MEPTVTTVIKEHPEVVLVDPPGPPPSPLPPVPPSAAPPALERVVDDGAGVLPPDVKLEPCFGPDCFFQQAPPPTDVAYTLLAAFGIGAVTAALVAWSFSKRYVPCPQ